jgi:DNA-binding PadR family transcriptional regulator
VDTPLSARAALLQALVVPGYGVELIERIRRRTGGLVALRMGSVYPALGRLRREGLVRSEVEAPQGGAGRPRKYYELTPRGVETAWRQRLALSGLLRAAPHRPEDRDAEGAMRRLARCARLSASLINLRRTVLRRRGR